ncbi:dimethylarginine dimethylaminohydrolase family protein [Capnocytophaga sp. G2]|uniref:dimethylarginine dimethylaminohydrolase family protein n=1 Tax=Capnocytophaga sp. G2 TaxID=3110695 RepID=UPI003A5CCC93
MKIQIKNETNRLRSVILGTAQSNGATPTPEEAYDPKSLEHILNGTYPIEKDMILEMEAFAEILRKYEIHVYRPEIIEDCNQIFARDIGFVIDDKFIKANILPERENEFQAIEYIVNQIPSSQRIMPPPEVHIEGGDVMPYNEYIFVGTYKGEDYQNYKTARTNMAGVNFLKELFPNKIVKEFDLVKSNNPHDNALHLDCCFQPVGVDKGIIYKGGFRSEEDYQYLVDLFGKENLFHIEREEMYQMFSNIFSIAPDIVVSERNFIRLNQWLRAKGFTVEEIPYAEISKQEGLLRCSTLPLLRD